jgi:acyl-CoA thioester hydrolase
MFTHKFNLRVRYADTDRMAIVYHSNYIVYFDTGRTEFLRALGFQYSKLEEEGIWFPVLEVGCKYKKPAKYDEEVTVETHIEELSRVKVKFGYKVYKGEELLVEGYTQHGFTTDKLKPIALNKVRPDIYKILVDAANND